MLFDESHFCPDSDGWRWLNVMKELRGMIMIIVTYEMDLPPSSQLLSLPQILISKTANQTKSSQLHTPTAEF